MNGFTEKIHAKKNLDSLAFEDASKSVNNLIDGQNNLKNKSYINSCEEALADICGYFKENIVSLPKEIVDTEDIMQYVMNEGGIMRRRVVLNGKWWKEGAAPLLCQSADGIFRALLPSYNGGYEYSDNGVIKKVTRKNENYFEKECYCFYKSMPFKSLKTKDFIAFMLNAISMFDVVWLVLVNIIFVVLGMIMPAINKFIFNTLLPSGTSKEIIGISVLLAGTVIIQSYCGLANYLWITRIGNKTDILVKNAMWGRVMMLPSEFFRKYSSGEISQRVSAINQVCDTLSGQLIPTLLTASCSVIYLFQIWLYAGELLFPSVVIVILIALINLITAYLKNRQEKYNNHIENKLSGMVLQSLNAISKIKIAGAEVRIFDKWAKTYRQLKMKPDKFCLISPALNNMVIFGGTIVLYVLAYESNLGISDYIAFDSALSLFLTALLSVMGITSELAQLKPAMEMLKPVLEEIPENSKAKVQPQKLSGAVELNHIKFRYNKQQPDVLNNIQLKVTSGEYIGITGSSGCGKSTLLSILLGFEDTVSGTVYYDNYNINDLDLRAFRKRVGVVLQNDKLFPGDIYSNITLCAPQATVDDVWNVLEKVGLADCIREMPMGLYTVLSEGGGGLSGGQKQLLLIARILLKNPDIIMFDEATSALDNVTQSKIVKLLDEMECTRFIIAHNLSTIKNCSKIIYLDKGKIVETGTYEELMALNGKFAAMAKRQLA